MTTSVEEILASVKALPADEQERLRQLLRAEVYVERNGRNGSEKRVRNISPGLRWISEHSKEYIGEWVALDGDRLICHDKDHRVVFAAADAAHKAGSELPLVHLVYDPTEPFMGGWV